MLPKFTIGEGVIVVPTDASAFIATVTDKEYKTAWRIQGGVYDGWGYRTDPNPTKIPWAEYCLRKRPKGTGKGLTEFMDSLKQPEVG